MTWLTPEAHTRLRAELAALLVPAPPSADDTAAETAHRRATRIRELRELLANAVVGEDPPDDGVAEPGMVLTVRYDDTGEEETFLLGLRDAETGDDLEVYSPLSPLGTALTGARPGEQRSYRVPNGATVRVTLVAAVPYGHHRTTARQATSR
ncbi:GreA/GreB family elongation factor [Actinophytocola sp. KF-1]